MSGWEIAAVAGVLLLVLVIGIGLLIAHLWDEKENRRLPPEPTSTALQSPPIVIRRKTVASVKSKQISIRSNGAKIKITPQRDFGNNEHNIETREIKTDLDLLCKVTCRVVRDCRCRDCQKSRANLGN